MKKITTRLLAVVLCVAMLVTVTPFFAAAEIEIGEIVITDADITPIIGEKAGDHLGYTLSDDTPYIHTEQYWHNDSQRASLTGDDVFEQGNSYSLMWVFVLADGYVFSDDATILINGSDSKIDDGKTTVTASECVVSTTSVEAQMPPTVSEIIITDANITPAAGERVGDHLAYTLPDDAPYTCTEQYWYNDSQEMAVSEDDCFVQGDSYSLKWAFAPAKGYTFSDDVTISLNGSDSKIDDEKTTVAAKECIVWTVSMTSFDMSKVITEINLFFPEYLPAGGRAGDYSDFRVPDDAPYAAGAVSWFSMTDWRDLWENDLFVAGDQYITTWVLWANEGYIFAENAKILVNGCEGKINSDATWFNGDQGSIWTTPVAMDPPIMISEITLTDMDITPVLGEKGSDWLHVTLPENCGYTICEHVWHNASTWYHMSPDEVFVEDNEYFVYITFTTLPEYAFSEDVTVTINGSTDPIDTDHSGREGAHSFVIWTKTDQTPPPTEITEIHLTEMDITPLASGRAGGFLHVTLPENCGYTVSEHFWNEEGAGSLTNDQTFVEGNSYRAIIKLTAEPGYVFAGDVAVTVNGSADQIDSAHGGRYSDDTFSIWMKPQEAQFVFDLESGIHLMVGKTWVNTKNTADVLGNGRVSYDDKTKTLTLNNATLLECQYVEDAGAYCTIYADQFITVNLVGSSMLHQGIATLDKPCCGVFVQDSGDECPPLLTGAGNLSVYAGDTTNGDSTVIYESTSNMEIASTGSVFFQAGACGEAGNSTPISCLGDVLFSGINLENEVALVSAKECNLACRFLCDVTAMLFDDPDGKGEAAPLEWFEADGEYSRFCAKESYAAVTFSYRRIVIDTVELGGSCYAILGGKVGDVVGFTVPEGAPYHFEPDSLYWMNDTDNVRMTADDTFEKGKSYSIGGCLVADEEYVFAENPTFLLNGGKVTLSKDQSKIDEFDAHRFSVWSKSREAVVGVVDAVEIDGFCVPNVGERVGDRIRLTTPEGAHYRFAEDDSYWYDYTDMSPLDADDTFKAEMLYALGGTLVADKGYVFAENLTILLDGGKFDVDKEYTYLNSFNERNFYISAQPVKPIQTGVTDPSEPSEEKLLGDANDDGAVNMKDVLTLRKMLASIEIAYNAQNADVNGDGEVNMKDVLMLRKYLAGLIETLGA